MRSWLETIALIAILFAAVRLMQSDDFYGMAAAAAAFILLVAVRIWEVKKRD